MTAAHEDRGAMQSSRSNDRRHGEKGLPKNTGSDPPGPGGAAAAAGSAPGAEDPSRLTANEHAAYPDLLRGQLEKIPGLRKVSFYTQEFGNWHKETGELLEKVFGGNSHVCQAFQAVMFTPLFLSCQGGDTVFAEAYQQGLTEVHALLRSCFDRT